MRAIIITGAPGSGKSTVLTALTDLLAGEGVEHVAVEVDELSRGHPWRDGRRHLRALAAGSEQVVVATTVESPRYLRELLELIGCESQIIVRLYAPPELLVQRIRARETVPWSGLPALIERTPKLQETIASLPGVALALSSEHAGPAELALAIRDALRSPACSRAS